MKNKILAAAVIAAVSASGAGAFCVGACQGDTRHIDGHRAYAQEYGAYAAHNAAQYKAARKAADAKHDAARAIARNLRRIDSAWRRVESQSQRLHAVEWQQLDARAPFRSFDAPIGHVEYEQRDAGLRYRPAGTGDGWSEVRK